MRSIVIHITALGKEFTRLCIRSEKEFRPANDNEDSSGDTRRLGSITKAGDAHVRRLHVEAAWHHRRTYTTAAPGVPAGKR
ncbi:hypothetical protein GCM10023147_18210 [Tsukamurella soli]|uniref:Transposase IS116/IS110/IS902 C-terminal domain-containing protein n=1 Tax=Tsukamurella soli TaxID=644556 RepID=A0ABP8JGD5_9ACTN